MSEDKHPPGEEPKMSDETKKTMREKILRELEKDTKKPGKHRKDK